MIYNKFINLERGKKMIIKINKLKKDTIFCDEYADLQTNNIIDFSDKHISVIYGPNGTGKTSLASVLDQCENAEYEISIDGAIFSQSSEKVIHLIEDQNGRNIIKGKTDEFLLGENIKREFELRDEINQGFIILFENKLNVELKNRFGISTKSTNFDAFIKESKLKEYVSDIANNKQKGKSIKREEFLEFFNNLKLSEAVEHDEALFEYFINDLKEKNSRIKFIDELVIAKIKQEPHFHEIEETKDAIYILEKYDGRAECIVCDNSIESDKQLNKKKNQNSQVKEKLDEISKNILEEVLNEFKGDDPFELVKILQVTLATGEISELQKLKEQINKYKEVFDFLLTSSMKSIVIESGLITKNQEYQKLKKEQPKFEDEDVIFIEKFLNQCLNREIRLIRAEDNNLKLLLGNEEFLGRERRDLKLSNGEQNFLSISFELLKAKKSNKSIIILDDPISSFDSIYKNKIAYAIVKFLNLKNTIILTHNTDLIKLLEHQHNKCFVLYLLNNTPGEENGFIHINGDEIKILLYCHEFLDLLRSDIKNEIIDERAFLISITPFMRGYCQLINKPVHKNKLTKVMHGYETEIINLTEIYSDLFGTNVIANDHQINTLDILSTNLSNLQIIKDVKFPLLSKTLHHTFTYLYLRLAVEKKLVDKYGINTKKCELLTEIISKAFNSSSESDVQNRVFFLSRKTLLNEFNHFEMDLNIFQPAIDISNQALFKERDEIVARLRGL
jgi:ABC-type lipoprotein export system ATPase subunit/uncharacterized protein YaiL (DUF2058 family)